MVPNQSVSDLNKELSSNFYWPRSANPVKYTEECVMYTKKQHLVKKKKKVSKWAKHR